MDFNRSGYMNMRDKATKIAGEAGVPADFVAHSFPGRSELSQVRGATESEVLTRVLKDHLHLSDAARLFAQQQRESDRVQASVEQNARRESWMAGATEEQRQEAALKVAARLGKKTGPSAATSPLFAPPVAEGMTQIARPDTAAANMASVGQKIVSTTKKALTPP